MLGHILTFQSLDISLCVNYVIKLQNLTVPYNKWLMIPQLSMVFGLTRVRPKAGASEMGRLHLSESWK
jgi:hypothetical protein